MRSQRQGRRAKHSIADRLGEYMVCWQPMTRAAIASPGNRLFVRRKRETVRGTSHSIPERVSRGVLLEVSHVPAVFPVDSAHDIRKVHGGGHSAGARIVQEARRGEKAMPVPVSQMWTVATYVLAQKIKGRKQYPLVLMLEPLFRCNLACAGCGKIQYPRPRTENAIDAGRVLPRGG